MKVKTKPSATSDVLSARRRRAAACLAGCAALVGAAELPAAGHSQPTRNISVTHDGTVLFNGVPTFLIGAGWLPPETVPEALDLGINVFQSRKPGTEQALVSRAVGDRAYVVPEYSPKTISANYSNAIGYALPDEADADGYFPPTTSPEPGKKYLPRTSRVSLTGRLITQTLTPGYMSRQPRLSGIGEAEYRGYISNTDVVLVDAYPGAHQCVAPNLDVSIVYGAMTELRLLAPGKTIGQWIETGGIEGYCGVDPVSPEMARGEAWAAVAGGAQAIYWFTHSWTKGYWDQFDITPAMADAVRSTNHELYKYSKIFLAQRAVNVVSSDDDSVKIGLRLLNGQPFLIAVNLSPESLSLADDRLTENWWANVPGLKNQTIAEVTSGRLLKARDGHFDDRLGPYDTRIYTWLAQAVAG